MRWLTVAIAVLSTMICAPETRGNGVEHRVPGDADECGASALPAEIQSTLARDFAAWKIQQASALGGMAHGRWAGEKRAACAGLAVGRFTGKDTKDYGLLLVPARAGDRGLKFVVFSRASEQAGYKALILEEFGEANAADFFIRSTPASDWFGSVKNKALYVQAADCIEMIDCGEKEYETDLYYWSKGKFTREWIDN
jgi:hypothetical protein